MLRLRAYLDVSGRSRFKSGFDQLENGSKARIGVYLDRLERENFSAVKSVGGGVSELKIDFGPGFRVYFGRDGDALVLLLCGGTKKRQNADIVIAKRLWAEYKVRRRDDPDAIEQRLQ